MRPVLLTGATGFVGGHLYPALRAAGYTVRCGSRRPAEARRAHPERTWVHLDVEDPPSLEEGLAGCEAAFYLVHGLAEGGDYPAREAAGARAFAQAARAAGLRRIVYLGGPRPRGEPTRHLRSRLHTGEILRQSGVSTVELRPGMIVGAGSLGWKVVRDLVTRLPILAVPRWMRTESWPVGIRDVVAALLAALSLPDATAWYDLPGPERVTLRQVLQRMVTHMGRRRLLVPAPGISPRLVSHAIALLCDVDRTVASELLEAVLCQFQVERSLWDVVEHELQPLDAALAEALTDGPPVSSSRTRSVARYYEAADRDFASWSPAHNMHLGYWEWGANPLDREAMLERMNTEVLERLRLRSTAPLLFDLGCGVGTTARHIARRLPRARVWGVTVTPAQAWRAHALTRDEGLADRVRVVVGDFTRTPFPDDSADGVYALESTCYAPGADKAALLREVRRVLRPGGRFVVADTFRFGAGRPWPPFKWSYQRLCRCWALEEMPRLEAFLEAAAAQGLRVTGVEDVSWRVAPSVVHLPVVGARLLWKQLLPSQRETQRWRNIAPSLLGPVVGMHRSHIGYYMVMGERDPDPRAKSTDVLPLQK